MATIQFSPSDSDSDSISVTSTVLSDPVSEYEVESILDEHTFGNQVRYLVKWVGYPTARCSWEPPDAFSSNETLKEWRKKKRAIAEGQCPAFDTDAWEEGLASLQAAKQDRQNRRQAKRRKLGLLAADADTQLPTCLSKQNTESVARPERGAVAEQPNHTTPSQSTAKPKVAESNTTSHAPKPLSVPRQTLPRPVPPDHGPDGRRPSRPAGPSQPPILFGNSQAGAQPGPHRAKKSLDPDPFRRFNLSTQRRFEKAKHDEPHPDTRQLELFRPSDFPRRSGAKLVELRIHGNTCRSDTRVDGPSTHNTDDTSNRAVARSEEPSTSAVVTSSRLQHPGRSLLAPYTAPIDPGTDPCRDIMANLPPRKPGPKSRKVHSLPGLFWNPGEVLVHIYYGPDKKRIGPARLCGLSRSAQGSLIRSKSDSRIKLWFQHPLNSLDCQKLCLDVKEDVYCAGWIEGFEHTEPWIYRIGQHLRDQNLVAFLFTESSSCDELIAYSPASQDFTCLDCNIRGPTDSFLRLAVTEPGVLAKQLHERLATSKKSTKSQENASLTKRSHDVTRRESCHALAQGQPNKPASPVVSHHKSSPTVVTAPQPKGLCISEQSYEALPTPVVPGPQTVQKPMDVNLDNANEKPMPRNVDNEPSQTLVSHKTALNDEFFNRFGVSFSVLTAVDVTEKSTRCPCFYIMYPRDAQETEEFTSLVHLLETNNASIYSNKLDPDWKRFLDIKNGIFLIHESFMDRYSEPWFRELTHRPSWRFSLSPKPAETCFHRLFPTGGVVLITEDFMVQCPEATVIMLQWLHGFLSGKFPGSWKIMFPPDVLNWLRTVCSAKEKRPGLWLVMYHLILKLHNSNDGDLPDGSSDAYTESAVISPPSIPFYGSKSEDEHPFTPKDLTQEYRKADHLIEFFAGWALVNSHRFRRFYVFTSMSPIPRWKNWYHLHPIFWGEKAVLTYFNVDYAHHWSNLYYKSACREEVKSQVATPFTPHTPKAPSAPTAMGSVDKGHSTAGRNYPRPYS